MVINKKKHKIASSHFSDPEATIRDVFRNALSQNFVLFTVFSLQVFSCNNCKTFKNWFVRRRPLGSVSESDDDKFFQLVIKNFMKLKYPTSTENNRKPLQHQTGRLKHSFCSSCVMPDFVF